MTDLRFFVLSNFARLGFQLVPAVLTVALVAWGAPPSEDDPPPEESRSPAQRGVTTTTAV
jgi:hypothetical protein